MRAIHALLLNLLFGLNAFILFFLLFESRIVVPPVLQVAGRMHPMLLHFPIVLLVLAWVLALLGRQWAFPWPALRRFVYFLLLASAWSAAVTVVAGLLLARSGDYGGDSFQWHKWTGVGVCFLSAGLLWGYRRATQRQERHGPVFLAGLSCAVAALLVAGHFGASLTHGADYLLEPLRRNEQRALDVETAVVYADLVYPILQAKCLSCHNDRKSKGGLVLSDTVSLLQGGESGPALAQGSAEESLMIERLLLDLNHEHRMPPKGKPQLTADELALIEAWVRSGASFSMLLAALPAGDTIRYLAEAVYGPPVAEQYDFPAADQQAVEALNTPYRSIRALAQGSPALLVSFYGKTFYAPEALQELAPISNQIVSLNLSGMPLALADSETLGAFANLRELALNDTPVDDAWAEALASLPALRHLSLSGTRLTEDGLAKIMESATLRAVYVWNTAMQADALASIQQKHPAVRIERGYVDDGSVVLPLNSPVIAPASSFFRGQTQVSLSHPIPGVELRYSLDGSPPDSLHSLRYTEPFAVESATLVKVRAYKNGWLASEEVARWFHQSRYEPQGVALAARPHPRYRGRESVALFDLESGGDNHADGNWLGFHGEEMSVSMRFDSPVRIDTVGIHVKQDYGIHVYPPHTLEIWAGEDSSRAQMRARIHPELAKPGQASGKRMVSVPLDGGEVGYLRIVAKPISPIPDGFPGASHPAWIFVDEIVFY